MFLAADASATERRKKLEGRVNHLEQLERQLDARERAVTERATRIADAEKVSSSTKTLPDPHIDQQELTLERDQVHRLRQEADELALDAAQRLRDTNTLKASAESRERIAIAAEARCKATQRAAQLATHDAEVELAALAEAQAKAQATIGELPPHPSIARCEPIDLRLGGGLRVHR